MRKICTMLLLTCIVHCADAQQKHTFSFRKRDFVLDGKPFQIISGEMHPARIPRDYWRHRIRMAKAMGCNTIAAYIFWNYHQQRPGAFDFKTGNHDIAAFIRLCQQEGMWVLLRPGPYVCAEWDFGGLPPYLLKIPDIRVRCMDPRYMQAVASYVHALAQQVRPLLCGNGGPILMTQIENEYGSYANDRQYIAALKKLWVKNGIPGPFYTSDGPSAPMISAGKVDSAAIGLDSGTSDGDFEQAFRQDSTVPAFSSETYPGWLTHWKEPWQKTGKDNIMKQVSYLLEHHRSFNLYVIHGGTNFGFTAGANAFAPTQFQPDVTSYDYDAPINEQGAATPKYFALRELISKHVNYTVPPVPGPIASMEIPSFGLKPFASLWSMLPKPVKSPQPVPMEALDQNSGFILYRTKLVGHTSGKLSITEPHDYALVFLDGKLIDTVYRDGGQWTVTLPRTGSKAPQLDILVENMGHINFAQFMIDRKGITDRVTLNGMTLCDWEIFRLPMDDAYISSLRTPAAAPGDREGIFFKANITLDTVADTYLDLHNYRKGVVWVNGHNLGRYWNAGPQFRLYCPAPWLRKGKNEIIVFDLLKKEGAAVAGAKTLE